MESSRQIEERAAEWLLKRERKDWSGAGQAQLTEWLEAATMNRVAFLRLEAGWEEANRLKALGAGLSRGKVPSVAELANSTASVSAEIRLVNKSWVPTPLSRWALAATLLAFAIGAFIYNAGPLAGDRYATPIGGVTSVPLKDGSNVTLNTASRILVQMNDTERRIELTQGEAFFEVAKDPARPFIVQAAAKRVIAVGTKFSVRRDGDDVQVVVTEGAVRLEDVHSKTSRLAAGAVARTTDSRIAIQSKSVADAEDFLSWRSGYVVFHETSLADAVAEFNRYNERKIVIADAGVAAMRLTGKFRYTNYETFVRLLEDTFHIQARRVADQIVLTAA
jgi:transmembrane sensor